MRRSRRQGASHANPSRGARTSARCTRRRSTRSSGLPPPPRLAGAGGRCRAELPRARRRRPSYGVDHRRQRDPGRPGQGLPHHRRRHHLERREPARQRRACCSATSRPAAPTSRWCWRSGPVRRRGSTGPPTVGRPGPRRSATRTRPRSTTAWTSTGGGRRGLAVSDPVDGRFRILSTDDGGRSWEVLPTDGMPDSTGEANFAASGDCLVIKGKHAWFGSGGTSARIFHSTDRGLHLDRDRLHDPERRGGRRLRPGRSRTRATGSLSAVTSRPPTSARTRRPTPGTGAPGATAATSRCSPRTPPGSGAVTTGSS